MKSIQEGAAKSKHDIEVYAHENAIYAGAIGAALWGAFRNEKLKSKKTTVSVN